MLLDNTSNFRLLEIDNDLVSIVKDVFDHLTRIILHVIYILDH